MSEIKHTPGPWHAEPYYKSSAWKITLTPGNARGDLANILYGLGAQDYREVAANARLIAAAPELVEMLNEFLQLRDWVIKAGGTEGPLPQDVINKFAEMQHAVAERAQALIARLEAA